MTALTDLEAILAQQELPIEFLRPVNSHNLEDGKAASMLSGMPGQRQPDEAICPLMLRHNVLIPANDGQITRSAWRVE